VTSLLGGVEELDSVMIERRWKMKYRNSTAMPEEVGWEGVCCPMRRGRKDAMRRAEGLVAGQPKKAMTKVRADDKEPRAFSR
jgi:hypothetical protein